MGTHLPYGITQCYLPPRRGDIPAFGLMCGLAMAMSVCTRALACILYELYIGEPPFFADGLCRLIKMVVHSAVHWPSEFPPLLRNFLERLLIKDPQTRLSWPALLDHEYIKDLVQGT